ncbi:MAG: hypothetical protein QM756_37940 [Polyangiaceae bacterium]
MMKFGWGSVVLLGLVLAESRGASAGQEPPPWFVTERDYANTFVFQGLSGAPPFDRCRDHFFDEQHSRFYQLWGDVAFRLPASVEDRSSVPDRHLFAYADDCPATLLIRRDGERLQAFADSVFGYRHSYAAVYDSAPSFTPFVAPQADVLGRSFAEGRTLYWMSGDAQSCLGHRVEALRPRRDPSTDFDPGSAALNVFVGQAVPPGTHWGKLMPLDAERSQEHTWQPFFLVPGASQPALLMLGTLQRGTWPLYKCRCERLLRVMRFDGEELQLLGRFAPGDPKNYQGLRRELPTHSVEIEGYDPSQVERWFTSQEACERARLDAVERIRKDGRLATKLGLHGGFGFDY